MNYRYATILAEKSLAVSGTELININVKEPISRIDLIYKVTKGLETMAFQACHDITRIELIDGSEVLHSLSGYENQALCIYDRPVPTMSGGIHLTAVPEVSLFGIDFGRWLYDPMLAFDPTKYSNPQLKVTYTRTVVDTSATANSLQVRAHIFDEKVISPIGFLMSKEHHNEAAPANDSYKYVDLPTDFPLRRLLLRAYEPDIDPWTQIKGIRLDEDNEKRIPLDILTEDYYNIMKTVWPGVSEIFTGKSTSGGQNTYVTPTDYNASIGATAIGTDDVISLDAYLRGGKVRLASTTSPTCLGVVKGFLPLHCFDFPFGDQKDIDDWYDITRVGSLRLRVQGGATGTSGEFQIVLQQLKRY